MTWVAKTDSTSFRHTLNSANSRNLWPEGRSSAYAEAVCAVELDTFANGASDLPWCAKCEAISERTQPRRQYHPGKKLPRCKCPTCGGVHIKDRNHVEP